MSVAFVAIDPPMLCPTMIMLMLLCFFAMYSITSMLSLMRVSTEWLVSSSVLFPPANDS